MLDITTVLATLIFLYTVFRFDFDLSKESTKLFLDKKKYHYLFFLLGFLSFSARFYFDSFFLPLKIYIAVFLLIFPDIVLLFLHKKNILCMLENNKENEEHKEKINTIFYTSFITLLIPELMLVFIIRTLSYKKKLKLFAPIAFSDTDQKLHSILGCFLSLFLLLRNFIHVLDLVVIPVLLAVIAAYYSKAGLDKVKYDWLFRNKIFYLKKAAEHQLGWKILPDRAGGIIQLGVPIVFGLEILSVVFLSPLVSNNTALFCLASLFVFHTLVLISSGINFWKWKLALVAIALVIPSFYSAYSKLGIINACFAYFSTYLYFLFVSKRTPVLGWLDSPISNFYKIEIKTNNSKEWVQLNPYWLNPFDVCLSQNRLSFLFNQKSLVGCLGAVRDKAVYDKLIDISENIDEEKEVISVIKQVINLCGKNNFNEHQIHGFIGWIKCWLAKEKNNSYLVNILSSTFSHIRNGYGLNKNKPEQCELNDIKIIHTRKFWSQKIRKFILITESEIAFKISSG